MRNGHNPTKAWARILFGMALAGVPSLLPAQVSLATVVDLAQRNSSTVKLAEADVMKAQSDLSKRKDVFIPSAMLGSGLPAFPSVGFTGGVPSILNGSIQSLVFDLPQKQYIGAARTGIKAAELNLREAREHVALDASTAYLELDTVDRELEAAQRQQICAERLVRIEQERSEAGVDPLNELLQAQLEAAQLKLRLLHLQSRAATLSMQLSVLTGLPTGSITPDRASIPEIPQVHAEESQPGAAGISSAQMLARSKQMVARGDSLSGLFPLIAFNAQFIRSTTLLNDADSYYRKPIPTHNFSSGFSIQIPLFDVGHFARAKGSAADALRATVEAEQAQRQNEVQIAQLTGSLRELDAMAEIASLKQQIAGQQLQSVLAQLELGNSAPGGPGAPAPLTPKAEQLARIDEQQKLLESIDAGFDLAKARLSLLSALGHMGDWLHELHAK